MIKDSGDRKEFDTGAVRGIQEGKGRMDLVPMDVIGSILHHLNNNYEGFSTEDEVEYLIYELIELYKREGNLEHLKKSINLFIECNFDNFEEAIFELSKHYEEGAKKYELRNWEKGIPLSSFIGSASNHFLKHNRGDEDERHDRAFLWNIVCAIWTHEHKPEMNDLPFGEEKYVE